MAASMEPVTVPLDACRACGGAVCLAFSERILGRYAVQFRRCNECGSLQSEKPYWLEEAYSAAISATDTGAMIRNLQCQAASVVAATLFGIRGPILDFGGGAGVLCRMLRDRGYDAYLSDKHAEPVFARAYSRPIDDGTPGKKYELVTAVEVLEHCEYPKADLRWLLSFEPRVLLATTEAYEGQGPDWPYLSKETGQHIFFYSRKFLQSFANENGYDYFGRGSFHVFSRKKIGLMRRILLRALFSGFGLRIVRVWLAMTLKGEFAETDNRNVDERLRTGSETGRHGKL